MSKPIKIDVWLWRLEASPSQLARWRTYLDAAEHARMARFVFFRDQTRFTICRSRVRRILGWYTATPPREITFETTGRNKPVLAGDDAQEIQFNLSHTDELACLAICLGEPIGVDVERLREVEDKFIAYALNAGEHEQVLALAPKARRAAFFRIWTAKEAYLKAIGTGLWKSLKTFDVQVPFATNAGDYVPGKLPRIDDAAERELNWHLYTFQATDEHIGAIAVAPPTGRQVVIRTRWFS